MQGQLGAVGGSGGDPFAVGHVQSQAFLVVSAKPNLLVARGWPTLEISDVLKVNAPRHSQPRRMSGKWAATAASSYPCVCPLWAAFRVGDRRLS